MGMVDLGKQLYFDPRLSNSGFISCNSCHNLSMGGTGNIKTSIGDLSVSRSSVTEQTAN